GVEPSTARRHWVRVLAAESTGVSNPNEQGDDVDANVALADPTDFVSCAREEAFFRARSCPGAGLIFVNGWLTRAGPYEGLLWPVRHGSTETFSDLRMQIARVPPRKAHPGWLQ